MFEHERIREVDVVEASICSCNCQVLALAVHRPDTLLTLEFSSWHGLTKIPVLDGLVPRAGRDHRSVGVGRIDEFNAANSVVVGGDLVSWRAVGVEVEELSSLVRACTDDFGAVLVVSWQ